MEVFSTGTEPTLFWKNGKYLTKFVITNGFKAVPEVSGPTNPVMWDRWVETKGATGYLEDGRSIDVTMVLFNGYKTLFIRDHLTGALFGVLGNPNEAIDDNVILTVIGIRNITLPTSSELPYIRTICVMTWDQGSAFMNLTITKLGTNNYSIGLAESNVPSIANGDPDYYFIGSSNSANIITGAESMYEASVTAQQALELAENLESSFDSINSGSYVAI